MAPREIDAGKAVMLLAASSIVLWGRPLPSSSGIFVDLGMLNIS